jgi:hypothetical protein
MKILKVSLSVFLLVILGLVVLTPYQSKIAQASQNNFYTYFYPYFTINKDINNLKATDKVGTIYIPKISTVIESFKPKAGTVIIKQVVPTSTSPFVIVKKAVVTSSPVIIKQVAPKVAPVIIKQVSPKVIPVVIKQVAPKASPATLKQVAPKVTLAVVTRIK